MRRAVFVLLAAGALVGVGCQWNQSKKYNLTQPKVEEFNPPPDEARYNNPPEDKYRRPPVVKDQSKQGAGGGGMGPAMMNPNAGPGGR